MKINDEKKFVHKCPLLIYEASGMYSPPLRVGISVCLLLLKVLVLGLISLEKALLGNPVSSAPSSSSRLNL
jgi:hypothetical protein